MKSNIRNIPLVFLFIALFGVVALPIVKGQEKTTIIKTKATKSAPKPLATIPFELKGNHIYLNVTVNNSSVPLSFILDTGASTSVISVKNMEALKLESGGTMPVRGAGGDISGQLLKNVNLSVVGIKDFKAPIMIAIPLARLEAMGGQKIDGVLGHEFFRNFPVKIDYQKRQMEVFDKNNFEYKGTGEVIPLLFKGSHPHISGKINLNGKEEFEGDFVIDIGSSQSLLLTTQFINDKKLVEKISPIIELPVLGGGVGGEIKASIGRIKKLHIGNLEINEILTTLSQSTSGAVAGSQNYIGNIGTGILKHFKVIFDYPNKQMILEKTASSFQEQAFNKSGIFVGKVKEDYKIFGLIKDSPAVEAGVQVGDILLKINGVSVTEFSVEEIHNKFKTDGKLKLEIKRENRTLRKEFQLRKIL